MKNADVVGATVAWVASSGGFDGVDGVVGGLVAWWRRWLASIVDGGLGSSTQRALTWKSLCVPSGEFGMHRGSLLSVLNSCLRIAVLATCRIFSCLTVCLLPDVFLHSCFCLVMAVYIMTVILAAVLCCLRRDPARGPFIPRPKERKRKREREKERKREKEKERKRKRKRERMK